jgi:transcription initiation factor TFIIIB Brf1 subunit/transcription initiation factor TFIIB
MIRQNKSLYHNNNYSSSSLFNIGPEYNRYRYHDAKIAPDKDAENANDDTNNKKFIQSINNALSYSNGKEIIPKKEKLWYNNTNNNIIGYSSPPTSYAAPFISIIVPAHNERLVIDRLMRSCAALIYNQDNFEIVVVDDEKL